MDWLFSHLAFFTSGFGTLATIVVVGAIVLLRDWRLNLAGLLVVQTSVATSIVFDYGASPEWMALQIGVMGLGAMILGISAYQMRLNYLTRLSVGLLLRLMALLVVAFTWWSLDIQIALPRFAPPLLQLLAWIALSALLLLGLSDRPLFTGSALLLWCIPAHAVTAVLLVNPSLLVAIGIVELLLALACSYLILVDRLPLPATSPTLTDIAFPVADPALPRPRSRRAGADGERPIIANPKTKAERPLALEDRPW